MKACLLPLLLLAQLGIPSYANTNTNEWQELGQTSTGNTVSVLELQIRKGKMITTRIRNELLEPRVTEEGNITRIEADIQINCSSKTVSPIRTFLFDEHGKPTLSVNLRGGKEFIKKDADSAMGIAIQELC